MKNLNKINCKLKYEKFYSLSDEDWQNPFIYTYNNLSEYKNDIDFLNTFKDKLRFDILFFHYDIDLNIIEQFTDCYDDRVWSIIFNSQKITVDFVNKYYKHIKFQINPTSYIFDQITNVNIDVKVYLLENGYLTDLVRNYCTLT